MVGCGLNTQAGTSYSPRGVMPAIAATGQRFRCNMISMAASVNASLALERTISWFQTFRRLCIRYKGFLDLGCSIILLKRVLR